jgi:hypothetical protein
MMEATGTSEKPISYKLHGAIFQKRDILKIT